MQKVLKKGPKFCHKSALWGVPKAQTIEIQGEPQILTKKTALVLIKLLHFALYF